MVDFTGQKRATVIPAIIFLIATPLAILYALIKDNYLQGLYFIVVVSAIVIVVFGPPWPYLSMNKPQWRPDSEFKPNEAAPAVENAKGRRRH